MIEGALAGTPRFFRWTHRRKDGALIDTEISLKAVSLDGEQVLLATMRDVTAQIRHEQSSAREASESAALTELLTAVLASSSRGRFHASSAITRNGSRAASWDSPGTWIRPAVFSSSLR